MKTKLFLHMGPGFHAEIERELFEKKYADVDFWTQPKVHTFHELISAGREKLNNIFSSSKKPISLIAHSFGAQIVRSLLITDSDKISNIIFINASLDPFECFINSGKHLPEFTMNSEKINDLRRQPTSEKMAFIYSLAAHPHFSSIYWYSKEKMIANKKLFSKYPLLDIQTFAQVFQDYLDNIPIVFSNEAKWNGNIKIYFSKNDVLIDEKSCISPWLNIFPAANIISFEKSGHYSHIEDQTNAEKIFC